MKTFTFRSIRSAKNSQSYGLLNGFAKVFGLNAVKQVIVLVAFFFASSVAFGANTWYTLASGKWTDPQIWTLDPAGAVPINPSSLYPNLTTDNIVVRTGITVTIPDGLTPYNAPLENKNNLDCGTLTVNGDLDFGVSTGHKFTQIKGNGRLYFESDNFPVADWSTFITPGVGGGTIVLKGITNFAISTLPATIYNLEINNSDKTKIYTLNQNLTVGGNLTVESGVLQINSTASTTVRNLTINGNVNIKSNGQIITGTTASNVFHWMNVYGDFTNNGVVDFSNSAQYVESTNGAVKLKFLGATNNNMVCNGTTDLYRLFVDKGSDQTYTLAVNANSSSNFKLFGTVSGATTDATDGTFGWQRLPLVITNGTLKLESNIIISRLGSNITGTAPNEFTIPATAQLHVNGATITSSNATGSWNGVTIYGILKIESGSLTTPSNTNGLFYGSDGTTTPVLEVLGGDLYVTQIRPYSSSTKFQYLQSGGIVHFDNLANDNNGSAVFHLNNSNHIFEMSGGTMSFKVANAANGWATGIRIESGVGNYSVNGGDIEITENATRDFMIFTTVPLYNIATFAVGGVTTKVQVVDTWGTPGDASWPGDLKVANNLIIASGTQFVDNGGNLNLGGDLTINGTFTQTGKLTFDGAKNATVTNGSGSTFAFGDFNINKDIHSTVGSFYSIGLAGANGYSISKNLNLLRGQFDVVNFNVPISGNIEIVDGDMTSSGSGSLILNGSTLQTIKGASEIEQNFGRLQLNNTSGVKLLSDVNATSVLYNANVLFDLDIYNLDISIANYTSGSWGTSRMFKTSGKVSDGGLTLPITLNTNYGVNTNVQVFPIGSFNTQGGSTLQYNPAFVDAKGSLTNSGKITVKPVNSNHPTVSDASKVIPYYWKVSYTGLSGITPSDLRYRFTYAGSIPASVNKGVILNGFAWNEFNSAVSGQTVTFPYSTSYLTVDYSIGNKSAFNAPRVLYSKASGAFNGANTWTLSSTHSGASASVPNAYDFCIIGGTAGVNHTVTISANNADASQVYIKGNSETGNSGTPPTLYVNSGTSGNDIDILAGNGRLVYENNLGYWSDFTLINGNHADLSNSTEAIIEYTGSGAGPRLIPVSTNIPYYPNLTISGSAGTTQTTNSMNLVVKGNLDVESSTFLLDGNYAEYVKVSNNVIINSGTLTYESIGVRYMNVDGDIVFTGSGTFNATTGGAENILTLKGNIQQASGTINFGAGGRLLTLALVGTANSLHTSNNKIADFYRITNNKSSGVKAQFSSDFNLSGATNGATKALTITSGECHLNNSNISIDLSTGGNPFKIPTGTTLRVDNGSRVNVGGSASNTGIWLDGALIVDNAGKVYCNQGSGGFTDNYIEYTSSGTASIWLGTNAELLVGSQLRRTTTSGAGVLQFTQAKSSSVVTLGMNSAPTSNRGVFEILNGGSSFIQSESGSNITIVRAQTAASAPTLLITPETVSIASGAGFTFGDATTPVSQNMGVYSSVELMDLTIGSTNTPTVTVKTGSLSLGGNLINGGTFNAAGYDVVLKGNLTNNGTFTPAGNTTWFSGSVDQTINGTNPVAFYDLTKLNSNTLIMSSTVNVANDLTIGVESPLTMGGTINTGSADLNVSRNLIINGTVLSTGSSNGVVCNGSILQQLSGNATFDRLYINNANGLDVPTQSMPINITDYLHLENGVFNIGKNSITLDVDAVITATGGFSATRMVQTNLSFTDNGIRKTLPQGSWSALTPYTFTYPIGSAGKYTPVVLKLTENGNNTGSVRVKAANEKHISIQNDPLTTTIDEAQNVLQYNWTLDASGVSGFTGVAQMDFSGSDVLVEAPKTSAQYITARILFSSTSWNKFDENDFDEVGNNMIFKYSGTNDSGIDGDYTAGISDCIPDDVPTFISVANNASWADANTWALYTPATNTIGVAGVGVPAGGPRGSVVYINTRVTMPTNFMAAYRTNINSSGILSTGTSFGHRLGDVNGTGTLQLESGNLPAGVYDHFLSIDGGTLEYTGSTDYSILSEVTTLNNLKLSGSGQRNLPNIGFAVLGKLSLTGADLKNPHNTNYSVNGNIQFTGGTFDANTATVSLSGTKSQVISGTSTFKNSNAFYNLVVNNSAGIIDSVAMDVSNILTLTNGVINTDAASLTLTNTSSTAFVGGSNTSFVDGPLYKQINNSSNFSFPVGDNGRYGLVDVATNSTSQGLWKAEYFNHSPATDNFTAKNSPVVYVSANEYWSITAPSTSCVADITGRLDNISGVNPSDPNSLFVKYAAAIVSPATPEGWTKATATWTGDQSAGTAKTLGATFTGFSGVSRFTFGASTIAAYTWTGNTDTDWFKAGNWSTNIVPSASSNATIANVSNKPIISGSTIAQTNGLTINNSATLTVGEGGRLTVGGALNNLGTIVVKNTPLAMASVITNGTITAAGTTRVDNRMPKSTRYWYYGLPVNGALVKASVWDVTNPHTSANKHLNGAWVKFTNNNDLLANNSLPGFMNGYAVRLTGSGDTTLVAQGTFNNGDIQTTIPKYAWGLVCNPYLSYIDMSAVYAATSADYGSSKIKPTIWVPTNATGSTVFATYNLELGTGSNGGSKILAPTQAFWIANNDPSNDLVFTMKQSARVHNSTTVLKSISTNQESSDIFRIELVGATMTDETVMVFRDGGVEELTGSDSEKRINSGVNSSNLYTIKSGKSVAISKLPLIVSSYSVPLTCTLGTAAAGNYSLVATNLSSFDPSIDVYLEDVVGGVTYNLRDQNSIPVLLGAGVTSNRYVLHFELNVIGTPTVLPEVDGDLENDNITIQQLGNEALVTIPGDVEDDACIVLYGIEGQLIKVKRGVDKTNRIKLPTEKAGYIIKVINGNHVVSGKVVSR